MPLSNTAEPAESLLVDSSRREELRREAGDLPSYHLNRRQLADLDLLLNRGFHPLAGYLGREDYAAVLESMRLARGDLWPIPICLDVPGDVAKGAMDAGGLALRDGEGFLLALLRVEDAWRPDKRAEALAVYGCEGAGEHPGVRVLWEDTGPWYLAGPVEGLYPPRHHDFSSLRSGPGQARRRLARRGWERVLAVHSDDPLFLPQVAMIQEAARAVDAGIFLQGVVELAQPGDRYHYAKVRCWQRILSYFPGERVELGLVTLARRPAGPRAALWLALIAANFGCTHYLVARDQADPFAGRPGRKPFYPRGAALRLLEELSPETGVVPVEQEEMLYLEERGRFLPRRGLDPGVTGRVLDRGEVLRRLEFGEELPAWFCPPEVAAELAYAHPPRHRQGFTILLTGLPAAGKSTLAKALVAKLMERRERPVTLLDGDIVRRHLSSELGFSAEHRHLNVVRIGFVASEITKNGGVAVCAPIAPYRRSRRQVRRMISAQGGFVEVYVATPLEVCQERDPKGNYARARAGLITGYTGVDDPYEVPRNPELRLDTSRLGPEEAARVVMRYLADQGYLESGSSTR